MNISIKTLKIKELRKLAKVTKLFILDRFKTVRCNCGISSTLMSIYLNMLNVKHEIHQNEFHAFLVVNNYIVDVTADQFGKNYKEIYVVKKDKIKDYIWDSEDIFYSHEDFISYQNNKESDWPKEQILSSYKGLKEKYLDFIKEKVA